MVKKLSTLYKEEYGEPPKLEWFTTKSRQVTIERRISSLVDRKKPFYLSVDDNEEWFVDGGNWTSRKSSEGKYNLIGHVKNILPFLHGVRPIPWGEWNKTSAEQLKTKKLTKVCMGMTSVFCSCWKFFRTKTPIRNVDDFDYYIWDLRSQCENELHYKDTVKNLPFFIKEKDKDEDTELLADIIDRDDVERWTNNRFTDKQWELVSQEIERRHDMEVIEWVKQVVWDTVLSKGGKFYA